LYQHLNETLSTLCMFYPDEALQRLEEVSYLVKNKDNKNIEEFLRIQDKRMYAAPDAAVSKATGKSIDSVLKMVYVSQNNYMTVIDFKFRKSQCPSMTVNQVKRAKKKLKKQENLLALCPISVKITSISTPMQVLVSVNTVHISYISL
jgi:iron only hydrogenase large subunit-like protein